MAPRRVEGPPRAGFALLLGKPNVGKSTLLNRLVGEHLAIVSNRPQTTRQRMLGMVHRPGTQLVLVDAPGVHKARGLMNRAMVEQAMGAMGEVDVILYLAEAGWPTGADPTQPVDVVGPFHREILQAVQRAGRPVVLVLTKIDLLPKPRLLPVMQGWSQAFDFKAIYPLSGLTGDNVEGLVDVVRPLLPESGPLFPDDQLTDQTERTLCAEYVREQLFLQTRQEIPYGTAVTIDLFDESDRPDASADDMAEVLSQLAADPDALDALTEGAGADGDDDGAVDEDDLDSDVVDEDAVDEDDLDEDVESDDDVADAADDDDDELPELTAPAAHVEELAPPKPLGPGLVRIEATIILERDSHKGIVIGKRGAMLRQIGSAARARIERLLGCRVWLGLHVRVIPGWTERRALLAELGLDGR